PVRPREPPYVLIFEGTACLTVLCVCRYLWGSRMCGSERGLKDCASICVCQCVFSVRSHLHAFSIADALFGQCQDPTQQRVQYQVSVPVLQKLQDVLKQLMMQGLSWQDDIVQYVISKELSRVPQTHVPARPRDVPPSQMASVLKRHGIDVKSLSLQQLDALAAALRARPSDGLEDPGTPHGPHGPHRPLPGCLRMAVRTSQHLGLTDFCKLSRVPVCVFDGDPFSWSRCSVVGPALMFRLRQNQQNMSASDVADRAVAEKTFLESQTGLKILQTGVGEVREAFPTLRLPEETSRLVMLTLVGVACVGGILVVSLTIACLRHHARQLAAGKLGLGPEGGSDTHFEYQDLCRQHMAGKSSSGRQDTGTAAGGGGTDTSRVSSVSSQFSDAPQPSPSSHSSTPSWCEEPAQSNMDISTGHMILAYMEDHLKNKDRLLREWEALCSYQAEPSSVSVAQSDVNHKKNRNPEFVPYDHSRVKLKAEVNPSRGDYINASTIIEHDPRMPAYIATQGPLSHTISDFWQMVWESGCTVIVMMTALVEDGEKQCDRYWPDEGSSLYHIYEVNLVSEHIWCNDFLVRSFYLKNVQTQETRTLTQFHFLSWPAQGIPTSTRPLLDFRRKVNKCYRGRSCPIIVHCSDGTGRTGTYILIDMVLNRMAKGVKEIDIAATLEHIRDQRPGMVRTKDQFEFALTAVAEEVNAILKALPQ
uniref:Protein tyrosine phosphatase receptor type N n=1 Tax=Scleropages formosus TaxID=113540 RepID=A0A8C9TJ02_SCLFO